MPRNTRNFWIEADIDGRGARLTGGPITVYIRDEGDILRALEITGHATRAGELTLTARATADDYHDGTAVTSGNGRKIEITTRR